jgi:hypothetical protein
MTRISRREVKQQIKASVAAAAAVPDQRFVDGLEARLLNLDIAAPAAEATVLQLRRHVPRAVVIGVVAASLTGAVAAAAIVGTAHESRPPITFATTTSAPATTTTPAPTTTVAPAPTVAPPPPPPTSRPEPTTTTTEPRPVPTTEAIIVAPPPKQEPTTTTEVRVPATMTLTCTPDGVIVRCSWSPGPASTDHYLVLRSDGRAFTPDPGATSFTDPGTGLVSGGAYSYLVHAIEASGTSVAHSDSAHITMP